MVWEQVARERGFYCCFIEIFWGGISLAWHASKGQVIFLVAWGGNEGGEIFFWRGEEDLGCRRGGYFLRKKLGEKDIQRSIFSWRVVTERVFG